PIAVVVPRGLARHVICAMHGYLKIKKMRSSQEICKACSCDGLQMTTRWEKYPMASMSLIPDEIRELRRWAKEYHYEDRRGPQPGALLETFSVRLGRSCESANSMWIGS